METKAKVYITGRGRVYHTSRNCKWLVVARDNADTLGRTLHPMQEVAETEVGRRVPCRVCQNGGDSPKRGPGRINK